VAFTKKEEKKEALFHAAAPAPAAASAA